MRHGTLTGPRRWGWDEENQSCISQVTVASLARSKSEFSVPPAGGTQAPENSGSGPSGSPVPAESVPGHFLMQRNRKGQANRGLSTRQRKALFCKGKGEREREEEGCIHISYKISVVHTLWCLRKGFIQSHLLVCAVTGEGTTIIVPHVCNKQRLILLVPFGDQAPPLLSYLFADISGTRDTIIVQA